MLLHNIILFACFGSLLSQEGVIVDTLYGPVQGQHVFIDHYGFNVTSFLGVPFARPPVDALRFEPPQNPIPWDDVFVADRLGNACWQTSTLHWITHPGWERYDEDCLNINIYTPENLNPATPYPVMLYFYGGGFSSGTNIMYPGYYLAARDVVVVVANYRINIMGFSTTGDDVNPGNVGLYDQVLAMQWVQDNIANFGGNPGQVTIFGQSAGAASVGHHMVSPVSRGLFHAVIEQSGCDSNFWSVNWPPQMPWTYTQQVAEKVNCTTDDSAAMMDCLRTISAEELQENKGFDCTPGSFCLGHAPVIDGEFLIDNPLKLREEGNFAGVPLFSGFNREDGSLYLLAYVPEAMDRGFNRSEYLEYTYTRLLAFWEAQFTPEQVEDAYELISWFYSPWPYINDLDLNRQAMTDMVTDGAWTYTTDRHLRSQSTATEDVYFYVFAYRSTNTSTGIWEGTEWAGVPHSGEIPYVWGWPLLQLDPEVRRDSRIFIDIVGWNEEDYAYAEFWMDLYTNFAKTFNPTPEPVPSPVPGAPDVVYPKLSNEEARYLLIDNDNVSPYIDYRQRESALYREFLAWIMDIPITRYSSNKEARNDPDLKKPSGRGINTDDLEKAFNEIYRSIAESGVKYDPEEFENIIRQKH